MSKQELLIELKEKFEETKKELGFKSKFKEINEIFYIEDAVLQMGFVSESFSRQLCRRIVETYNSWLNYLHGLVMPTPGNIFMTMQNKMLSSDDRNKVSEMIKKATAFNSTNNLIGLKKDKKMEASFIDDSVKLWKEYFKPELIKITEKVNKGWKEDK